MRNRGARLSFTSFVLAIGLAACSTPEHTNTLIFATNTKIALDVSASPAGGSPEVTIGYKRQEVAWAPLLANQGSAQQKSAAGCTGDNCRFQGEDKNGEQTDAISVLASFGADIEGGATGAGVGIAQYFATGVAAQKLAEIGGADLVSVNTSQPSEAIQRKLALLVKDHMSDAETVATFVADGGTVDTAKMENVLKCVGYDASTAQTLASSYSGLSADAARQKLARDEDWLGPFANCAK